MSAREVIEQIEALPSNEKAEVYEFVRKHLESEAGIVTGDRERAGKIETVDIRYADDKDFQRAKEAVLKHHAPLLKKLAQ